MNSQESSLTHTRQSTKFTWSRKGGYECSSYGDTRFSALYAIMPDGRSLESHYQCDSKSIDVGGEDWRLGKGKPSLNPRHQDRSLQYQDYKDLWRIYLSVNPELLEVLRELAVANNNCLSDKFATSDINQARALADILNGE